LAEIANIPGMPQGMLEALAVKNIALDRPMVDYVAEVNQMLGEEHSLIMLKEVGIDEGLAKMARRSREIQGK
jgi:multiple sugar transport system substrate-binding protein